jgi:hypothetical protein
MDAVICQADMQKIQVDFDTSTIKLFKQIGEAKAAWFSQNNWVNHLSRLIRFGLSVTDAENFQQFLGLAGEAAVWQWLWGDLGEFWEQQAFLHESKALSDGGQDLPGLDVKTRDLIYFSDPAKPDLLLTPNKINQNVYYVLCIVLLDKPIVPLELTVQIAGTISGQTVLDNQDKWYDQKLQRIVISQDKLAPIQTLRWAEHHINRKADNL